MQQKDTDLLLSFNIYLTSSNTLATGRWVLKSLVPYDRHVSDTVHCDVQTILTCPSRSSTSAVLGGSFLK